MQLSAFQELKLKLVSAICVNGPETLIDFSEHETHLDYKNNLIRVHRKKSKLDKLIKMKILDSVKRTQYSLQICSIITEHKRIQL